MKKIVALFAVLALVFLCACGNTPAKTEKQTIALSDAQLKEYSEAFNMVKDGKTNVLCCFLMSDYEKIENMDFDTFMHNFPEGEDLKDEKEFEALKALDGWTFGDVTLSEMPLPIHKYSRAAVDEALKKHGNTSSDKLTVGKEKVLYLKDYDAFYNFTSDFALGSYECTSGETDGETTTLYSKGSDRMETLKIKKSADGEIVILSHTTEKMTGLANPWTDCTSLAEAEKLAGFGFGVSEQIGSYKAENFRVMEGRMLEVIYKDGDSEVTVRKTPGADQNISGDYNEYEKTETTQQNGFNITFNYIKGGGTIVLLSDKENSYSVSAYGGFNGESCNDFINAIVGK